MGGRAAQGRRPGGDLDRHVRDRDALRVNACEGAGAGRHPHRAPGQPRPHRPAGGGAEDRPHPWDPLPGGRPRPGLRCGAGVAATPPRNRPRRRLHRGPPAHRLRRRRPVSTPVVTAAAQILAHTPGLARLGSKPGRELGKDPEVEAKFLASLPTFEEAVSYLPHQAHIGAVHPRVLPERPWVGPSVAASPGLARFVAGGEVMPEEEFLGLLAAVDQFGLITLDPAIAEAAAAALATHPLAKQFDLD